MSDIAIRVENLGKKYNIRHQQQGRQYRAMRDVIVEKTTGFFNKLKTEAQRSGNGTAHSVSQDVGLPEFRKSSSEEFWALKDVSFEVKQGEAVGIIGRNGAGKSTLLKLLSRITEPTTGRIELEGRVASLLEVGTGFHPELTGRENIYLNGAIMGMGRAEIRRKFDEIVAFAEVEKFLDTPVKRYSSGMYMRLAFAVAAHLEPDILVVDEVLTVGDAEFQKKCLGRMRDVSHSGRTVLFVSHQINAVESLCSECFLLVKGQLHMTGKPLDVICEYVSSSAAGNSWTNAGSEHDNPYFKPIRFNLVRRDQQLIQGDVKANEELGVLLEGEIKTLDSGLVIGFAVYTSEGTLLFWSTQTDESPEQWPRLRLGTNRMVCWLPRHLLNEDDYRVELIVSLHWRMWLCQPGVNTPVINFRLRGGLSQSPHWMERRPGLLAPILPFEVMPV